MLKICVVITAKPELTREQFLYYWTVEHVEVVGALPGIKRYVQNIGIENSKEWPFTAMAEVYFETKKDIAIAFSSPEADVMREHEKLFIQDMQWIIATEHEALGLEHEPVAQPSDS